jgi:hypothetical protein
LQFGGDALRVQLSNLTQGITSIESVSLVQRARELGLINSADYLRLGPDGEGGEQHANA